MNESDSDSCKRIRLKTTNGLQSVPLPPRRKETARFVNLSVYNAA